ncbi:MAG TPA: serine/threonine-protein kinase, partial [Candidatus Polarisedimenticolaceae bacterium]|nr:serine/threonine-protein kinase [Candidatus Polarisedimenticolaceae bacterium]
MRDSRWDEIDGWFARALECPPAERAGFLAGCPDREVRDRVERLLSAAERSGDLLSSGAIPLIAGASSQPANESVRRVFARGRALLDRYRVDGEIGAGGFGVVYRARDLRLEREVAIKVVAGPQVNRERLLREARAAAATNHPNLVGVFDVGQVDGLPFLVMELIEGPTLEESPPRTIDEAVRVAIEICRGLEHMHDRGMVHRDLKPCNVLRVRHDHGATIKLVDLGLVRSDRSAALTAEGHLLGTPAYLAPEQARGGSIDPRTDL